ncbi:hypothetical protein M407DRAFT_246825, partial [Tulasnella calospora MUT 4182]
MHSNSPLSTTRPYTARRGTACLATDWAVRRGDGAWVGRWSGVSQVQSSTVRHERHSRSSKF